MNVSIAAVINIHKFDILPTQNYACLHANIMNMQNINVIKHQDGVLITEAATVSLCLLVH